MKSIHLLSALLLTLTIGLVAAMPAAQAEGACGKATCSCPAGTCQCTPDHCACPSK